MTAGDAYDFINDTITKDLFDGVVGDRLCDQLTRFCLTQEANSECLDVNEVTRPVDACLIAHFADRLATAKEECQLGTILDRAAKPVEQEVQIQIVHLAYHFQIFELIE